jgi:nicotinamidase-related amidase
LVSKTALIVIDVQYIHVDPDTTVSGSDQPDENKAYVRRRMSDTQLPAITNLLDSWRKAGKLIVHIAFNHTAPDGSDLEPGIYQAFKKEYGDLSLWPVRTAADPLSDIMREVAPLPGEIVLQKTTFSAFKSTNIDFVLKNHGIDSLLLVGGLTGCCVLHTAVDAKAHGYEIYTVSDADIDWSPERHERALPVPGYNAILTMDGALQLLAVSL